MKVYGIKKRLILLGFFLLAATELCADRGDGFAGGLVGGLTGGMVAGALSQGGRRGQSEKDKEIQEVRNREHEREIETLRREKNQEKLDELRRALENKEKSGDSFILYILFFVVFVLLIGVGALALIVFRR